ncbi:MAG: DUF4129 domain-containing protein [Anaerolineae bacterium]
MAIGRDSWIDVIFRPLAVAGMMGCIAASLVGLIRLFVPGWSGIFIVVGCIIAALEATFSYRVVRSRRLRGAELLMFRASELALLLILLRMGAYVGQPWQDVIRDIQSWPSRPALVLDLEMLYSFLLLLLSWAASTGTARDLDRIGEPPVKDKYYVPALDSLVGRFFWGGILLLWTAGLTRIGISSLLDLGRPSVSGLIINVLIYFVLGLVVLGQIQFARLSHRWRREGLVLPNTLARHWVGYTLVLLGLAALIAFLLPTAYTLPLLTVAAIAIQAFVYVSSVIFQLAILLVILLLAPLVRLFGGEIPSGPRDLIRPPEFAVPPGTPGPPWLHVLRSAAFWAIALTVVAYVVRSYLRDRPDLLALLPRLTPGEAGKRILAAVRGWLRRLVGVAREQLPFRLPLPPRPREADRAVRRERFRLFRPGALSRRDRTLYYYLSVLRRAAREGYPRQASQTPYEYDDRLGPRVPDVESELDRLTDAFVETWYSEHEVEAQMEAKARSDWRKIRAALSSLRERTERQARAPGDESREQAR